MRNQKCFIFYIIARKLSISNSDSFEKFSMKLFEKQVDLPKFVF